MVSPLAVDIASSTQKLFEETILRAVDTTYQVFQNMDIPMKSLCYAGGVSLNCPTNSRIYRESRFENLYIPPDCDDSGISSGAALFLYHNILNQQVNKLNHNKTGKQKYPYLGGRYTTDHVERVLLQNNKHIDFMKSEKCPQLAAEDVSADKVIAWFEARSEIGPRALGHRSLIANPRFKENWPRLNHLKKREFWRPFAPAILENDLDKAFSGCPKISPYMLYTANVKSSQYPAITHVDGSARIQTVGPDAGEFYEMLLHLKTITGVGIVLNTSFNGPGEPIVESPEEALQFLMSNSLLDVLYIDGFRVKRR